MDHDDHRDLLGQALGRKNSPDSVAFDLAEFSRLERAGRQAGNHRKPSSPSSSSNDGTSSFHGSLPQAQSSQSREATPKPSAAAASADDQLDSSALDVPMRGMRVFGAIGTNPCNADGEAEAYESTESQVPAGGPASTGTGRPSLWRDSLDHIHRRQPPTRLRGDDRSPNQPVASGSSNDANLSAHDVPANNNVPPTHALVPPNGPKRPTRRSSLKNNTAASAATASAHSLSTLASTTCTAPSSEAKRGRRQVQVRFDSDVRMKLVERPSPEELAEAWLSKDERSDIQRGAKSDLKLIKRLAKLPIAEAVTCATDLTSIRRAVSLRGLEHFLSQRTLRDLRLEQSNVIHDVLDAQSIQHQVSPHLHSTAPQYGGPAELARISAEGSAAARDRAERQGREDEAAVAGYLGRTPRSSDRHHRHRAASRRGSMPTSTEMRAAQASHPRGLAEQRSGRSRRASD
jgi:hypothetical protein